VRRVGQGAESRTASGGSSEGSSQW
jgi:hypothetical protein